MREGETSRYGRLFWSGLIVGWAAIGFGLWSLVQRSGATKPREFATLFLGLLLAHDLVLVPVVCTIGVRVGRRVPPAARAAVTAALAVTGIVALVSFPLVAGFGRLVDNPSLLPRNYGLGLAIVLGAAWAVTAFLLLRAFRAARAVSPPWGAHREGAVT